MLSASFVPLFATAHGCPSGERLERGTSGGGGAGYSGYSTTAETAVPGPEMCLLSLYRLYSHHARCTPRYDMSSPRNVNKIVPCQQPKGRVRVAAGHECVGVRCRSARSAVSCRLYCILPLMRVRLMRRGTFKGGHSPAAPGGDAQRLQAAAVSGSSSRGASSPSR